jgi:hypothetical protein
MGRISKLLILWVYSGLLEVVAVIVDILVISADCSFYMPVLPSHPTRNYIISLRLFDKLKL